MEALSPEKRAQILQGAARIFAQDGYEGASMSRIATEANVSKGTLYNHFESKADLFAAFVQQEARCRLSQIFCAVDGDDDPAETLRHIARQMIEMTLSSHIMTIYRVVIAEASKFPDLAKIFFDAGPANAIRGMREWLAQEAGRGRLTVEDPEFAAEQFLALCQTRIGFRRRLRVGPEPSQDDISRVVEASVAMFLHSYGPEVSKTPCPSTPRPSTP